VDISTRIAEGRMSNFPKLFKDFIVVVRKKHKDEDQGRPNSEIGYAGGIRLGEPGDA
jgi:hypothetical protein